jgi:hypothetical protein
MENDTLFDLTITLMPHGGYVVTRMPPFGSGYMTVPLFAATEVDAALAFIRDNIGKTLGMSVASRG